MSTTLQTVENSSTARNTRRDTLALANSSIKLEVGQAGTVARIDHADGRRDYAGPLDEATIAALREVSR